MKVALVYPHLKGNWLGCYPPLSLLYLATSLKMAGQEIKIFDRDWGPFTVQQLAFQVIQFKPDLIGLPSLSTTLPELFLLFSILRKQCTKATFVIGGHHASAMPDRILEEFTGCEYVLIGEAEESLVKLCHVLEEGGSIESVPGLCYRKNGSVAQNPLSTGVNDLNKIHFPNRDLLAPYYRKEIYWRVGYPGITDVIITSRGCPFSCLYCFKLTSGYRIRSVENVLEEVFYLHSKGVRSIHIEDEIFTVNKKRAMEVLGAIKREKLGMVFKVRGRVDTVDEEFLSFLKSAGVKGVAFGFESGSQKMLNLMNKKVTVEQNFRAVQMTKKAGLQCTGFILLGYPGETPETINASIAFVLKSKPTGIGANILCPLPRTKVYEQAKKDGTLVGDWGAQNPLPWVRLPWAPTRDVMQKHFRRLCIKFYSNPVILFNAITQNMSFLKSFTQFKQVMYFVCKYLFFGKNSESVHIFIKEKPSERNM